MLRRLLTACRALSETWFAIGVIALLTAGMVYQHWFYTHSRGPILPKVGDHIQPTRLKTLQSQDVDLKWDTDSKATIIYAFTPTCIWCKRNLAAVKAVADQAHDFHFIAISLTPDGLVDYVRLQHCSFPVYIADRTGANQLGLHLTPETIVISPKGIVTAVWRGGYYGSIGNQVEAALHLKLPSIPAQ